MPVCSRRDWFGRSALSPKGPAVAYNFSLAILPGTAMEEGSATVGLLGFDEILASGRVELAGAQIGPHVVLVDIGFGESAKAYARDLGRQVYVVSFSGVSSTYVLEAAGVAQRLRVQIDGEVAVEQGAPLPVERELLGHEHDEDAHVAVFEALLGAPLRRVFEAHFLELTAA